MSKTGAAQHNRAHLTNLARTLRKNMTDAERKLWTQLRAKRFINVKFNRQAPIGPYIADFCSFDSRLIVEVDGGQHDVTREADTLRTSFLESEGFTVIRFWNNEVLTNLEGVMYAIEQALKAQNSTKQPAMGQPQSYPFAVGES
jgi:very-short-patch-repair endonuclease